MEKELAAQFALDAKCKIEEAFPAIDYLLRQGYTLWVFRLPTRGKEDETGFFVKSVPTQEDLSAKLRQTGFVQ